MYLGHYACRGFINPGLSKNATKYMMVELTDNSTTRLLKSKTSHTVLNTIFPYPLRMKKVWSMSRGDRSFYAWKAVPPDGYVAMGMVCTDSGIFSYMFLTQFKNCI